ncbi:MAG TPA: L-seryl-tRNA(Sec) selenium transferase [Pirellulaceae bacterium]|nr:L-seryl-tRNA(Sec) selenium transferase [Pirellulaceae bacterium]HMO91964.1 L-seryl-tRNA(Sec) selenium transferase [Pirellulaceae bacterium]HMP68763.1 L-seryl-tRNA(Sec) selenium transferase [Pirellulaceae bacterium]
MENPLRKLPSVNQLLESAPIQSLIKTANHSAVVSGVRSALNALREQVQSAAGEFQIPNPMELAQKIADWIQKEERPRLRPVINGTGVVLHTGLGRAPLAREAIEAISIIGAGYASVETDLESGARSQRVKVVERLLCELTGAEAAAVVNNNAAATMIVLSTLAKDKEVIVSRGQLVEIGGSYRLPEVMQTSGAKLVEVGTTNKTHLSDYADAINERTGAILRVHPSNFKIVGFTESVPLKQLVELAHRHHIPFVDDIGSGALIDFARFNLPGEPMASDSVEQDCDLVLFSGDKLLGGPQCGIIVGKANWVHRVLKHPLFRALRVDKLTLAALHATLLLYRDHEKAVENIPTLAALATPLQNLRLRADRLAPQIRQHDLLESVDVVDTQATLGGGSIPGQQIESIGLRIVPKDMSVDMLAKNLRLGMHAIIGRIEDNGLILDLRTIHPSEDIRLVDAIQALN